MLVGKTRDYMVFLLSTATCCSWYFLNDMVGFFPISRQNRKLKLLFVFYLTIITKKASPLRFSKVFF